MEEGYDEDKKLEVFDLESFDFSKVKITFFAAGGKISEKFVEKAAKNSLVIDSSSYFRMDPNVPLVVPQVNSEALKNIKKNIIANPNCSTAQLVIALKPLHDLFEIKRVVVSTYQSVSGGGKAPMDELIEQTKFVLDGKKIVSKNFTKQIAFNAIPHIDKFSDSGYTKEELKMTNETKKILDNKIDLTATCVRLPISISHAESVNIQFEKPFSLEKVRSALDNFEGCKVIDERVDGGLWNLKNPIYKLVYKYFKNKEKQFLIHSDHTISLTHNGKKNIINQSIFSHLKKNISVIPCCTVLNFF